MRQSSPPPNFSEMSTAEEEPFFVEIDEKPAQQPASNERPAWFQGPAAAKAPQTQPQPQGQTTAAPKRPPRQEPADRRRKGSRQRAPIVQTDDEPERELRWEERFWQWLYGEGGQGYGISVVVHLVLLIAMSLWILSRPNEPDLITEIEQTEVLEIGPLKDVDVDVDLKTDLPEQINNPEFAPAPTTLPEIGISSLAGSLKSIGGGTMNNLIPKKAVTKGSFTVWTVPEDPMPGEQYKIMIQVKLKSDVKKLRRSDIKGSVIGTDGYKDYFGGPTEPGYYNVVDKTIQFEVLVPGAAALVKDVIDVESDLLKEKQRIELVF